MADDPETLRLTHAVARLEAQNRALMDVTTRLVAAQPPAPMVVTGDLFPEVADQTAALPNDRYTTRATLDWCKKVLGVDGFDLDVAACVEAHHAARWYGQQPLGQQWVNGLTSPWDAKRIWCNPPYEDLMPWVHRAWHQLLDFRVLRPAIGMLIPDNRREQPFWQTWVEPYRDGRRDRMRPKLETASPGAPGHVRMEQHELREVCHDAGVRLFTHSLPGRQKFGVPGNPEGVGQQSPPFGVVLLEWRYQ